MSVRSLLVLLCVMAAVVVVACGADGGTSDLEGFRRDRAKEWVTAFAPIRNDIVRAAEKSADAAERLSLAARSRAAHRRYGGQPLERMFRQASHELGMAADEMDTLPPADGDANAIATRMTSALYAWRDALRILADGDGDAYAAAQQANEAQADVQEQFGAVADYIEERGVPLEELPPVIGPSE